MGWDIVGLIHRVFLGTSRIWEVNLIYSLSQIKILETYLIYPQLDLGNSHSNHPTQGIQNWSNFQRFQLNQNVGIILKT